MKELKLVCQVRIKKYKSYKGEVGKIAPNILDRQFTASRPDMKWVTDVTEFGLFNQKVYLSTIQDLYNGEIVSCNITDRPNLYLVKYMLETAVKEHNRNGLPLHPDQGWHYQMKQYQRILSEHGITQSMSRKGNCLDNAVM